jgi:acetyl-CoA synthetase
VLVVDHGRTDVGGFAAELESHPDYCPPVLLRGSDPFVILFTSGTSGHPKGVRWPLNLLLTTAIYMRDAIDLQPDDNYWNVADPGLRNATRGYRLSKSVQEGYMRAISEQLGSGH